jgi:hypothetical protein
MRKYKQILILTNLLPLQIFAISGNFWLLPPGINCACQAFSSSRWSVCLNRLFGRVFHSPAPLFLALALLKRGVVLPERLNLVLDAWLFISVTSPSWGYLVTL